MEETHTVCVDCYNAPAFVLEIARRPSAPDVVRSLKASPVTSRRSSAYESSSTPNTTAPSTAPEVVHRLSVPANMASSKPALDDSRRSSESSAPNTTASSSHRSSVDLTAANSVATSMSVETRARSSSITLRPLEGSDELAASAVEAPIIVAPLPVEEPVDQSSPLVQDASVSPAPAVEQPVAFVEVEAPAEHSAPLVEDALVDPVSAIEQPVAPVENEAPVEKKIKIRFNLGRKGKAPAEPAPVAAPALVAPKAKASVAAAKKASASRPEKVPVQAAPKAQASAKVKKESAAVEAPAKRARRRDPEAKPVQIDVWAARGEDAVKVGPKRKKVSIKDVKGGRAVGLETAGSKSELSVHGDEEFEGF